MKRIAADVVVAVPADLCYRTVQESLADDRWRAAYRALRPEREYSGFVTATEPPRKLEITVGALDPVTGRRHHALGYRVVYDFTPVDEERTRVEVAIEYELLAAVGGMGMLQPQAENEILQRLWAMVALEAGVRAASRI